MKAVKLWTSNRIEIVKSEITNEFIKEHYGNDAIEINEHYIYKPKDAERIKVIPKDKEIKKSISEEVKKVLEFFKNNNHTGINNTIYHLLSKDKKDYGFSDKGLYGFRVSALAKFNETYAENFFCGG
jgi:hypothetical protein